MSTDVLPAASCKLDCIRAPGHEGRCYVRRAARVGSGNPYAEVIRRARDARLHHGTPATPTVTLEEAALNLARADLAYTIALTQEGPQAARRVLKTQCFPARQAYRRALDHASKEHETS